MTLLCGGIAVRSRGVFPTPPVSVFVEPAPPINLTPQALRAAWSWSCKKVLGLRVNAQNKEQYWMRKDDMERAFKVFEEKSISPSAWIAWRTKAFVRQANSPPALRWLVAVDSLESGKFRGWFRTATAGFFGGKVCPTETQLLILKRWSYAQSLWLRGAHPDDALDDVGLSPVQLSVYVQQVADEISRVSTRLSRRVADGDPLPTVPPNLWPFGFKEP